MLTPTNHLYKIVKSFFYVLLICNAMFTNVQHTWIPFWWKGNKRDLNEKHLRSIKSIYKPFTTSIPIVKFEKHSFNWLNPWIVSAESLKIPHKKKYTNDCFNALRQGSHHRPRSNSLRNKWHSTPNVNNSGHNNSGSKFSVVMTKIELSMHIMERFLQHNRHIKACSVYSTRKSTLRSCPGLNCLRLLGILYGRYSRTSVFS